MKLLKKCMKHKLLIDSTALLSPLTGIGRYNYEIAKRVEARGEFNLKYFYGYYSKHLLHPNKKTTTKHLKNILSKSTILKKVLRKTLHSSSQLTKYRADIYWQPNFIPNSKIKAKSIISSVHDFSFILYKDYHPKERIEYFEKNFYSSVKKSDIIITGSEFTKEEIIKELNFNPKNIRVIYHGVDNSVFKKYESVKTDLNLPKKFILSVGSIEPRKNLIGLLKAYNLLAKEIKEEYHLVIVGFKGWNNSEIMQLINKNSKYIHYLGYISDKELAMVYNLASLFVYPSFYEGFGLPVAEAMACGVPVLTSNVSSLPEVGADAVLYCNPKDAENIKVQIETILSGKELQKILSNKGIIRATMFSWDNSATEHINVFKELL